MSGVKKAVNNFAGSTVGKVVAPTFTIPANLISKATGIDPAKQLMIGGAVGTGVAAAGAMGAFSGAGALPGAMSGAGGAANAGTTAALGQGGAGVMAQSGGVPLLTKVLLGASVGTTLAAYFGRKDEQDYRSWFDGLNQQDQEQVKSLESNLTELQSNLDLRDKAVQKVVADFPNVVSQVAPEVVKAKQMAGEEFDAASKQYMEQAMSQVASKYAAGGMVSSGAMNEAAAKTGADMALKRLDYTSGRADQALSLNQAKWQANLNEADALRSFQQKMLGLGVDQRFSATQNMLTRTNSQTSALAGIDASQRTANNKAEGDLFGSLGATLGSAAMLPMYQQLYSSNRAQALPNSGPQMPAPKLNTNIKYPGSTAWGGVGA